MFGNHFYNEGVRKLVIGFGQVFNNIYVQNTASDGAVTKRLRVPLAYAPKEKFLVRLDQQANLEDREFAIVLPRMSFEITGLSYDANRKLNKMNKTVRVKSNEADGKVMNFNYSPVPYNIDFSLNIFTATAENGLQIVEQILPYFQPDYTVTVNVIPEMNLKRDVPIILNTVQYEDSYNGDFTRRRAVIYTLNFTAKTYLYGPASTQKVIRETQSDLHTDLPAATREERITVVPNPVSADADDDFGFTTTISFFQDAKNYNIDRDEDV
jgi:hypothetical protein